MSDSNKKTENGVHDDGTCTRSKKELQKRLYAAYEVIHDIDTNIRAKRKHCFNQRIVVMTKCVRCDGHFTQNAKSGKYLCSLCYRELQGYIVSKRSKEFDQNGCQ